MKKNRGRDLFKRYSRFIYFFSAMFAKIPMKLRKKIFIFFRKTEGKKGILIRYILLKSISPKCGENVSIHSNVYLLSPDKITIGDNVSIHPMCYIDATGEIEIGSDVSVAHGVTILSSTHNYKSLDIPIKDQGITLKKTTICNDVWIGAKATILYGVLISDGAIIAANAVVRCNVERNRVVGGIPATNLRLR